MNLFLTDPELQALTGRERYRAQIRQLRAMGIESAIRADGKPIVSRSAVELRLGGRATLDQDAEPDWSALDAKKTA